MSVKSNITAALRTSQRDEAQTMAEYSVVLAVICVVTVGIFTALSGGIAGAVDRAVELLPGVS